MKTFKRLTNALVLTLSVVLLLTVMAPPAGATTRDEDYMNYYYLNRVDRNPRGIASLYVNQHLSDIARAHSVQMMRAGRLFHSTDLGQRVSDWNYLGENVGYGPSLKALNDAFMASTSHRANILYRPYRQTGIGIVKDASGRLWITEVFFG